MHVDVNCSCSVDYVSLVFRHLDSTGRTPIVRSDGREGGGERRGRERERYVETIKFSKLKKATMLAWASSAKILR